jgi:hypothetical protein
MEIAGLVSLATLRLEVEHVCEGKVGSLSIRHGSLVVHMQDKRALGLY